jgi:short-subunit dehydrogenase
MLDQTREVATVAGTHEHRRPGRRRDGASSGNGKALSPTLASKGARLVLAARRVRLLKAVAREVEERGGEAQLVPCDVTNPEQVHQVGREAVGKD